MAGWYSGCGGECIGLRGWQLVDLDSFTLGRCGLPVKQRLR
jgi:hypothetical protein